MTHITPDLIPHIEFHKGSWLLPVNGADWYYFMKIPHQHKVTDKQFMSSVDKPLRALVKFLQKKKINTTPSCSGHHFKAGDFVKIYDDLEADMLNIRSHGLEMKDVESGQVILYRDPAYRLPWTKQEFLKRIKAYQQKGVIGFEASDNRQIRDELLHLHIDGAKIMAKDGMIFVLTTKNRQGENAGLWRRITQKIKDVFKQTEIRKHISASAGKTG
ncbi:MAG: hypothetical protein ACXVPQ_08780 [Bacteroidia bacterium]